MLRNAVRMALCIECSRVRFPSATPSRISPPDALCRGCRWPWSSPYTIVFLQCIFKTLNIGIEYKKYNFWRNQEHLRKEGGKIKYIEENMGIDLILFIISSALDAVCVKVHKLELFYAETESL